MAECNQWNRREEVDDDEQMLKRVLGLVILRGETIVSLSVEGPPPAETQDRGPGVCLFR